MGGVRFPIWARMKRLEKVMRLEDVRRRLSPLGELFAERQVYLRAEPNSHYAEVSRGLQAGVAACAVLILAWLGIASYGWIASSLEAGNLRREVARLESANRNLRALAQVAEQGDARAAAELPGTNLELVGIGEQLQELRSALAGAQQQIASLQRLATQAQGQAEELQRELARTLREGRAPITGPSIEQAQGSAADPLEGARGPVAGGPSDAQALPVGAEQVVALLQADLAAASAALDAIQTANAPADVGDLVTLTEVRDQLARARERTASLDALLAQLKGPGTAPPGTDVAPGPAPQAPR